MTKRWTENGHKFVQTGNNVFTADNLSERAIRAMEITKQLSSGTYNSDAGLKPGVYTKTIRGTVNYVTNTANKFYEVMGRDYAEFQVISTNMVSLPDSVCMTITYRV